MIWLALDTSANLCAASLYDADSDKIMASKSDNIGMGHAERLMPMIAEILDVAHLKLPNIGGVIASLGPGSFTGVRIAVSAANGFAQADTQKALIGVTVLDGIAHEWRMAQTEQAPFAVVIDAKRDQFFIRNFDADGAASTEPQLCDHDAAQNMVASCKILLGSGAAMVAHDDQAVHMAEARTANIDVMARFGAMQNNAQQIAPLVPLYLRGADAKVQQGFALPRSGVAAS